MHYPKIILKKGKEISLHRRHHWVFSGAAATVADHLQSGDLVEVFSSRGDYCATGHYAEGSIMVRVISFEQLIVSQDFWNKKIQSAFDLRKKLGLTDNPQTNVYRLIHGEGDLLPGLIVDFYKGTAVIQCHQHGMYRHLPEISQALQNCYGDSLKALFDKSTETLPKTYGIQESSWIYGAPETDLVQEYGATYRIDWEKGQKTGFFIDQRENRKLLADYATGKKILNTFCYSGGFSVLALLSGAKEVHSVDSSEKALQLTEENIQLNPAIHSKHVSIKADVIQYIRQIGDDFDLIILDPPAFAKTLRARHNAIQAYKRLNLEALKRIKKGGILFTFSCSQVVDKALFSNTLRAAAFESGRSIRILHQLSQPADHPVNSFHPESEYLKGLVLYVE